MRDLKFSSILVRIAAITAVALVYVYVEYAEYRTALSNQKLAVSQQLAVIKSDIEARLQSNIELVKGLATYVSINPGIDQDDFSLYAEQLLTSDSNIRVLAASDAYIVTHLYPFEGNEKVFGMDYRDLEDQLPSIELAIETQKAVVSGPVELVQGGQALIVRLPISIDEKNWGIISVVIDYDDFISQLALNTHRELDIAIKGRHAMGLDGEVFFGPEALFDDAKVMTEIQLPHGRWIVTAKPLEGWAQVTFHPSYFMVAVIVWLFIYYNWLLMLRNEKLAAESQQSLHNLAHFDSLTGLPNRLMLGKSLESVIQDGISHAKPFALMFLDLDRFKVINDSLGHKAGDELLVTVSRRFKELLDKADMLARLGGDEFVVLIKDCQSDVELQSIAESLCDAVSVPFQLADELEVNIGLSIGISQYPSDAITSSELLRCADAAMYKAKKSPKHDIVFYTQEISDDAGALLTISSELKQASAENQFELLLQPQVNINNNQVVGAEALVRWNHPKRGFLTPDKFIPLAESTGSIRFVTEWVFQKAIKIVQNWREKGVEMTLSINVSAMELSNRKLFNRIAKAVEVDPSIANAITIEIVESAIVENIEFTKVLLSELREMGFKIAIDDFGIGFSSLSYLSRLSVDILKIDRAFVSKMASDKDLAIVRSIIGLAQNFNLSVIAEGIETNEQAQILSSLNCTKAQGYLYSKPIAVAQFNEKYLAE